MPMSSFIDNLEKWFDSIPDEEFLESWEKSTAGMEGTNVFADCESGETKKDGEICHPFFFRE